MLAARHNDDDDDDDDVLFYSFCSFNEAVEIRPSWLGL